MPVPSKVRAVEAEIAPVAAEIVDALKTEAPVVEKEVEHEVTEVVTKQETPAQALDNVVADAETAVKTAVADAPVIDKVEAGIEEAEHVGLGFVTEFIHEHAAPLAPLWDEVEPEVETRIFVVTNLVTSDFAHLGETYVVELEKSVVDKLHDTALKAAIEAKVLEAKGIRLLSNALHYVEVTTAKFIPHKAE
jgi:hypothetical protein